jgi:hypothetical protein
VQYPGRGVEEVVTVEFAKSEGFWIMERKRAILVAKDILAAIVRNVHLRRELSKVSAEPALNFWRLIYGNLTDMAVLEWCKLFGSDDSERQPVHWKSIAEDQEHFREDMLKSIGVSREARNQYIGPK